ncbi:conserved hypothetical protein [Neospora caninum Liverpool]|uniref:Uncharacterized protein n=1 Tax=Neospora caninum (strain Liverpool) TaxID=572307 RepID=F0VBX0_NEOCL|nr:conserved hypothetical protein [Neospora caninum Liverpool]CBZ51104.1 conserved hypothetical protein [Neospora caninum Liverpool]CEL68411.1 TPA: hypothetical protein BN1204_041790 [Neospora caninum Liverpool]|eukprot:XP_003881137.1 conserved hypothetical protein [Neospora caninum Liverpool]
MANSVRPAGALAGSPKAEFAAARVSSPRVRRLPVFVLSALLAAAAVAVWTPSTDSSASFPVFSAVQPAEAAGFMASMKRAANQGWRTGARWLCMVFGLQYESVKGVFRRSGRQTEFEALSQEVDQYLQLIEAAGHNEDNLPEAYQERGVQLVLEAQELFAQVLGKPVALPPRYQIAANRLNARNKEGKPALATAAGSKSRSGRRQAERTTATSAAAESAQASAATVEVPMRDKAFEKAANEKLRALKAKHEADVSAIVDEANARLKQFQEEHKMTYDKKVKELRAQQHAELEQVRRELQEETLRYEDGKKQYDVISQLLTEAKAGLGVLSDGLQFIGANFYSIDQLIDKVADSQKELEHTDGEKLTIQHAFQAVQHTAQTQEQGAQAALAIRTRSAEMADVVAQLEQLLSGADTALSTAPGGSLFESQQQGYAEYLRAYRASVEESKEKVTNFEQEADAKLLALTYALEQLQSKALGNLGAVTEKLATEYSVIQTKAQELEQGYQDFFDRCQHVEEQAVNIAKSAVEDRATFGQLYSGLQNEFNDLQVALERQGENVRQLNTDVSNVEKIAAVFVEGLNTVTLSREALAQLNAQPVGEMTRFFTGYKNQVSVASSALQQRFQVTQDLRRKLDLLAREIRVLADPAALESLEAELVSLMSDMETKQRDYEEVDAEAKQARAMVQTLQKDLRQLEQRLTTERRLAGRQAGLGGAGASVAGGSRLGGLGASFAGSLGGGFAVNNEAVRELEAEIRQTKGRLQDAERDVKETQGRATLLERSIREIQRDIEAKRRILTEEQQKQERLQQLAAAVTGGPGSAVAGTLASGLRGSMVSGLRGSMISGLRGSMPSGLIGGSVGGGLRAGSLAGGVGVGSRAGLAGSMGLGLGSRLGGLGAGASRPGFGPGTDIPKPFTGGNK